MENTDFYVIKKFNLGKIGSHFYQVLKNFLLYLTYIYLILKFSSSYMQNVSNYQFNQVFLVKISVLLTVKNCK